MGDHADDALEECVDRADMMDRYLLGMMDPYSAFDLGLTDNLGFMARGETAAVYGNPAPLKTCRCCGLTGLRWGQHGGKWRLFGSDGTLHACPKNPLKS